MRQRLIPKTIDELRDLKGFDRLDAKINLSNELERRKKQARKQIKSMYMINYYWRKKDENRNS